jgi:hypothetical protein
MPVDPISATNLAATLIQLIGLFRQERGARKDLTHREFIEWLEHHRHEEIKELITHTYHLQSQVDDLLRQDHAQILSKLDQVNVIVVEILSRVEGLSDVATTIVPDAGLSDQAVGILKLVAKSKEAELFNPGQVDKLIVDAYLYAAEDPRFLQDDITSLIARGFFLVRHTDRGEPYYKLTRRGAKFVDLLPTPDVNSKLRVLSDDDIQKE